MKVSFNKGKARASRGINAEWHRENVMPRNPSLEERIEWHIEHSEECGCRPVPAKIAFEIKKRKLS